MSKYSPLREFLLNQDKQYVKLTFEEIEDIIGSNLSKSAYTYRPWWANDKYHVQATNGWLAAGYKVKEVDFENRIVIFEKEGHFFESKQ